MRKKVLIVLAIVIVLLSALGISYAYWILTFKQTNKNVVTTSCLDVTFIEGNAINL